VGDDSSAATPKTAEIATPQKGRMKLATAFRIASRPHAMRAVGANRMMRRTTPGMKRNGLASDAAAPVSG
jgi:hypothetical protein